MWISVGATTFVEISSKNSTPEKWVEVLLEAIHPQSLRLNISASENRIWIHEKILQHSSESFELRIQKYPDLGTIAVKATEKPLQLISPLSSFDVHPSNPESSEKIYQLLGRIRKQQHIDICEKEDVENSHKKNGFEKITLPSLALVDGNFSDIDLSANFLNKKFSLPFLISGMTGGIEKASFINQSLAKVACDLSIPMGVGSQRVALEDKNLEPIFALKKEFPSLFLIANLGIAQLCNPKYGVDAALKCIEMIQADAIAIHVNLLQELVQSEGDRSFSGCFSSIQTLSKKSPVPIILKEVGCGIDSHTAEKLFANGVNCFDVGGNGGTSWSFIESKRSAESMQKRIGTSFRDWGTPTADVVLGIHEKLGGRVEIIASGGMRSGIDAAKALACGASMVGFALPLLRAVLKGGSQMALDEINIYAQELKICTFLSGAKKLCDLSGRFSKN